MNGRARRRPAGTEHPMPEKVAVDILDIDVPPSLPDEERPPEPEATPESGTWQKGRLLAAGLITLLVFSAGGYVLWTHLAVPTPAIEAPTGPGPAAATGTGVPAASVPVRATEMEGFVVDMQDEKGNPRVVLCGIALDVEGRQASVPDRDAQFRRIIYEALCGRKVESLMTSAGRNAVKEEIRELLAKATGAAEIRDVYFTKFVVV